MSQDEEKEVQQEELEFTAEIQQLLDILVHSLYTQREIFLRELISNASDALDKIRFRMLTDDTVRDKDQQLKIDLSVDKDAGTLTISDTGIGMTREDLVQNIGTIAHSGSKSFLQALDKKEDLSLIGQFGVGFYSVFMVAEKVVIDTLSFGANNKALRWTSAGTGKYTIDNSSRKNRGTSITLHLREDAKKFIEDWQLKETIRKYSDFVSYPIFFGGDQVNKLSAIWTRPAAEVSEEEYHEFYKYLAHVQEKPLATLHLSFDAPIQFYSVLFLPQEVPWDIKNLAPESWKSLNLYARRIFVKSDCEDLLPQYLRFVRGVVDSDDIPLNISRETLQENQIIAKIKKNLVRKILDKLAEMSDEQRDEYSDFWHKFGRFLKQGYRMDFENREKLSKLLRFNSSSCEKQEDLISLDEYVERMQPKQESIFFLSGESRETIERSPHLEIFRRKGVEVLYLLDPLDDFLLEDLREYSGKQFVSAEKEDVSLADLEDKESSEEDKQQKQAEDVSDKSFDDLLGFFKNTLKDRVSDVRVSKRLTGSPCCLVSSKDSMGAGMQKLMKMMDEKYEMTKRIMEINRRHPLIAHMARIYGENPRDTLLEVYCHQLLDSALLLDGSPVEPRDVVSRMQKLMVHSAEMSVKSK